MESCVKQTVLIQKLCFALFNLFLLPKRNLLKDGWQRLAMSVYRKLRILNWRPKERECFISSRVILVVGLKKDARNCHSRGTDGRMAKRGVRQQKEYEILTAEISKAAFGVTPSEYKKLKGLKRENLRDHMDDFELIFTMLGERVTTEISQQEKTRHISQKIKQWPKGVEVLQVKPEQKRKKKLVGAWFPKKII